MFKYKAFLSTCGRKALVCLANDISTFDKVELSSTKARVKVLINGLKPLIKKATLEYDSGEEILATLVYEKLEKHCLTCGMLDHDTQDCPEKPVRSREANPRAQEQAPHPNRIYQAHSGHSYSRPQSQDYFQSGGDARSGRDVYAGGHARGRNHPGDNYISGYQRRRSPPLGDRHSHSTYYRTNISQYPNINPPSYHSRDHRKPITSGGDYRHAQSNPQSLSSRSIWMEKSPIRRMVPLENPRLLERIESSRPLTPLQVGNVPPPPPQLQDLPVEALNEAIEEVRGVMQQYTNCADPSESAARKERLRQAEESGQVVEAAANMVRSTLSNIPIGEDLEQTTLTPNLARISALQRLGHIPEEGAMISHSVQEPERDVAKHKPGRPPGRRNIASSPLSFLGAAIRRRQISKIVLSPNCKRSTRTIPRNEENLQATKVTTSAGTSANPRRKPPTGTTIPPASSRQARDCGADFRPPSSLLP